jgi:hypothetical protein
MKKLNLSDYHCSKEKENNKTLRTLVHEHNNFFNFLLKQTLELTQSSVRGNISNWKYTFSGNKQTNR